MVQTPVPPGLDPTYVFGQMMPLIAVVTVILFGSLGIRWIFRTPVGEAIAQRIRHGGRAGQPLEGSQSREALEERVGQLQDQVAELAERVDFAERLLTEQRERQLGPGK